MKKFNGSVKNILITTVTVVGSLMAILFKRILDDAEDKGFSEATEIGVTNTIIALYDAGVKNEDIYRALYEHWNVPKDEAKYRVADEISRVTLRELEDHMKQLSYSDREIEEYIESNDAINKIKRNNELWKLKRNPEKLLKAVRELK